MSDRVETVVGKRQISGVCYNGRNDLGQAIRGGSFFGDAKTDLRKIDKHHFAIVFLGKIERRPTRACSQVQNA